jgi:hypothetical protein
MGTTRNEYEYLIGIPEERDHLGDLSVDVRIILN